MTPVVARLRLPAERQEEFRFRYRVYVDELGLRPREADHARRLLPDEFDRYACSYALVADGEIVGAVRLIFIEDLPDPGQLIERFSMGPALAFCGASAICTTSRFIIDVRFRGRKSMLLLMEEVFRDARARGMRLNYGDCSAPLLSFYTRLGYHAYAPSFDDPSYGPKIPLIMLADAASRGPGRRWLASRASFLLIVKPSPGSRNGMESGHGVVGIYPITRASRP
ncbi:MAG TPA: GNAT family N-acetyltransferase [Burkholderiales bacterium]